MRIRELAILIFTILLGLAGWSQAAPAPTNSHATPEARALLAYLDSISGKAIISGQHNYPNEGSRWTDRAYDLTGKYPGLFGEDFGFAGGDNQDSVLARAATIDEVKRQYKNGAVIALMWHAVRPTDDEPVTFRDSVQGHLTDYEWHELLTTGSPLYKRWCAQADVIAGYLRQLRDAHVPVLFRPYHEMNGNWFWWGGRPGADGSAALYRQLYDRFVNVHHLDNLVWVWNVNAPSSAAGPVADYYPGPAYADVVTIDNYGEFKQEYYESMLALAAGKPIALAEVGPLPTLDVLAQQPRWTYFMTWSGLLEGGSTLDRINEVYRAAQTLNRDDPRLAGPMEAIRKGTADRLGGNPGAEPVTPGATAEARALLTALAKAPGQGVLSGQMNVPALPVTATDAAGASERQPAIVATELEADPKSGSGSADEGQALMKALMAAHTSHAVVALNWRPARPTDDAPAEAHGQLTDFEWNELLTPGSDLNKRWCGQVDAAAATLRELEKAGIAVLWNPYPEPGGKDYWWAGRKGVSGSAALYRMLFDRLVNHDGVHNLVWVWETGPPSNGPGAAGMPIDFFPGLLYVDAVEVRVAGLMGRFPVDRLLAQIATGKPTGVEFREVPPPELLLSRGSWSWFILDQENGTGNGSGPGTPQALTAPARADALKKLYADPHVVSLAPLP
jgi:mannan endo-1,4-beta-mannosidase